MNRIIKNSLCVAMTAVMTMASTINVSAYSSDDAVKYARKYSWNENSYYKTLDQDCTGFVSQVVKAGGIKMKGADNFKDSPSIFSDWIMDNSSDRWYMKKEKRLIGFNYWKYSKSWAMVKDFRSYHVSHSAKARSGKLSKVTPLRSGYELTLRKNAKPGQIWQVGNSHSIVITRVDKKKDGYNYVWYRQHTSNCKKDIDIQNFFDFCNEQHRGEVIYQLTFS